MIKNVFTILAISAFAYLSVSCTGVYRVHSKQGIALYKVPPLAAVYIDGKYMGIGNELNGRARELSRGEHTLLILDNRHYPYSSKFSLKKGILLKRMVKVYPLLDE
ncbi:MAG: hypothetical protein JXR95_02065 [Deltaproteobacteria bacterium]|nr:hypothetical protein [Deltaproteobacteria bacterium]